MTTKTYGHNESKPNRKIKVIRISAKLCRLYQRPGREERGGGALAEGSTMAMSPSRIGRERMPSCREKRAYHRNTRGYHRQRVEAEARSMAKTRVSSKNNPRTAGVCYDR